MPEPVTDLRDTRVLIPRYRRAVLGQYASASALINPVSDEEANAGIADAIADIILYSGGEGLFGHKLEVVARDEFYQAPIAWQTDSALSEEEGSVIISQAALNRWLTEIKTLKTQEKMSDEGQSWEYQIAASVVTERIKALREDRDRALDILKSRHMVTDDYVNFLAVRDEALGTITDRLIEPWSNDMGRGGQMLDSRGFF